MLQYSDPLDAMFDALGDPARRAMVARLSEGPASVSELAKPFAMSLSAVGQHLKILEASGLVATEKLGRTRVCRLDGAALRSAEDWLTARRASWERKLDRLGAFLDRNDTTST